MGGGIGGFGSSNSPGNIQGMDLQNAMQAAQDSATATINRYQQLGLGGVGATPTGAAGGAVPGIPGSGTTPVNPGKFATGSQPLGSATGQPGSPGASGAVAGAAGGGGSPFTGGGGAPAGAFGPGLSATAGGSPFTGGGGSSGGGGASSGFNIPTGGPTAMEMELGALPSRTGGIPEMFTGVLGETQFQDIGQTTQAATGAQQAKAQGISTIGQLGGSLIGGI